MRIYKDALGGWVFFDGVEKQHFELEWEARQTMSIQDEKLQRAVAVQEWASRLADLDDFLEVVNARQFDYDQINEPTDDDLVELGITRDDYRNGLTMLKKIRDAIQGVEVATLDHRPVIARLRTGV